MLLPEQMSKILVIGTRDRLPGTIDLLYSLENIHVVDFSEEEGFTLGTPLPSASDASHKLLKLRSIGKDLELDEHGHHERMSVKQVEETLDKTLSDIESEIAMVVESKNAKQTRLTEAETYLKSLEAFKGIPLDLEMYRGYKNLEVFTGQVKTDPEPGVREVLGDDFEIFRDSGDSNFIALFVPKAKAEEVEKALIKAGFTDIPAPAGTGMPAEIASKLEQEISTLSKESEDVSVKLKELQEKHATYILASDEYLSIEVEKAELPLRMGATDHSFVLEAWVPTSEYGSITKSFSDKFGDDIYIELLETKERKEEHHTKAEGSVEAGVMTAEAIAVPMSEETPVKLKHRKVADQFSFYTKLINNPRYNEIDPTIALTLFFPVFFGLMIGDVGYGLIFTILGWLGLTRAKSKDWKGLSTILFYGGLVSMFLGFFLFGDLFGIEFTAIHSGESELSSVTYTWAGLLGIDIPHVLFNIGDFPVQLGYFSKLEDVKMLLYISVWIGFVHLMVGLILGLYNVSLRHGLKAAIFEKFSWILILAGGALMLLVMVDVLILGGQLDVMSPLFIGSLALLIPGLALALIAEGGKAIIELPELLSNVISYTRITAIGMSKSGMALAFNYIAIGLIAPEGGIFLLVALLIFVVGHLMIFILGLISAGLQSIRLQYVELFTKFFEGGGLEFNPLKIERKHTMEE